MNMNIAGVGASKMPLKFVTNKMCPFAQKAWIALEAASMKMDMDMDMDINTDENTDTNNVSYDLMEVSLYGSGGKPKWFLQLNPAGTVPVLVVPVNDGDGGGEEVYPDSELILDYLADNTALGDESENSKIQLWRSHISDKVIPIGKRAVLGGSKDDLFQLLEQLEKDVDKNGPFLCGKDITVADCAAFPFLWRIQNEYNCLGDGHDADCDTPRLKAWLDLCSKTKPFQTTVQRSWWWWW